MESNCVQCRVSILEGRDRRRRVCRRRGVSWEIQFCLEHETELTQLVMVWSQFHMEAVAIQYLQQIYLEELNNLFTQEGAPNLY